ncbi:MAG: hypothetical protein FJ278_12845, partial [Planctomycetes bacterium]|nr:hypothetical protein [Planctomycetota bacterium]
MDVPRTALVVTLLAILLVSPAAQAAAPPAPPTDDLIAGKPKGPWRRLFLDAMVVESQQGLSRVFHAAEKHPQNPVIRGDKPWEGGSFYQ